MQWLSGELQLIAPVFLPEYLPYRVTTPDDVLVLFPAVLYRPAMFGFRPFERAAPEEIETVLADAIRSSAGGQMTRNAEVFLAGACAKHLTDRLMLAGFVFMRGAD